MARKRRKNKLALPAGILTVILAIIGLAAVINVTVKFVKNKTDKTELKAEYKEYLRPVVMFDPDPFDDLTQADNAQLLNSAIWALLMDDDGMSKYPYSTGETFGIQVPQADIEESFINLFGTEIDIASLHSGIDMSGYGITYDAALKSYIIPITGIESAYTPEVYSIDKQGNSVVLTVGYINNRAWADIEDGEYTVPEPDKYMKITLRERTGGNMFISSIQSADGQEIASKVQTSEYAETESVEDTTEELSETEVTEATEIASESNSSADEAEEANEEASLPTESEAVSEIN